MGRAQLLAGESAQAPLLLKRQHLVPLGKKTSLKKTAGRDRGQRQSPSPPLSVASPACWNPSLVKWWLAVQQ